MSYFSQFPKTVYSVLGKESTVQDIFRRCSFISEYKPYTDLYSEYVISDGNSPISIAKEIYGSVDFFWVVLLFNEIHSIYTDWPLNSHDLEETCRSKYGDLVMYQTRHFELDGLIVGEVKEFDPAQTWIPPTNPGGEVLAVSFYDYETRLNDEKRVIQLLRPELLPEFTAQFEAALND